MTRLTHGGLFAGINGFGLGFARAGIVTKWHVEIDDKAQGVIRHHNSGDLILSDVRECGIDNLSYVDIISFGSPCQGLSIAGKGEGLEDERSILFFEAARIVSELKPAFAVWENVPGAFSSNAGRDFAIVLSALRECGARDIAWRVLDAQYFGVAQRRRRVFVVADFRGERAAEILFESACMSGDSEAGSETRKELAVDIAASTRSRGDGTGTRIDAETGLVAFAQNTRDEVRLINGDGKIAGALGANPGTKQQTYVAETLSFSWQSGGDVRHNVSNKTSALQASQTPAVLANAITTREGQRMEPTQDTLIAFDYAAQGSERTCIYRKNEKAQLIAGRPDAIAWYDQGGTQMGVSGDVANTLRAQSHGHPPLVGVRRLTPGECETLQGFPKHYTAVNDQSDSARYRQLGNAVCVPVIAWLGRRIVAAAIEARAPGAGV